MAGEYTSDELVRRPTRLVVEKVIRFRYVHDGFLYPESEGAGSVKDQAEIEKTDPIGTAIDAYLYKEDRDNFTVETLNTKIEPDEGEVSWAVFDA